jgi:hypothetical protein
MKNDKRIKWQTISYNGDATESQNGIVVVPITVQDFVNEIVLPDEREWGYICLENMLSPKLVEFGYGKIKSIDIQRYNEVKDRQIERIYLNCGWSYASFTLYLK